MVDIGILKDEIDKCSLCTSGNIEDEFHFMLACPLYSHIRRNYIPVKYTRHANRQKFITMMATENASLVKGIAAYTFHAFKLREQTLKNH